MLAARASSNMADFAGRCIVSLMLIPEANLIFQIITAIVLLRISGMIGSFSLSYGYASMSRAYTSGDLGFNLFYRILFVPISISLMSIALYAFEKDFLIENIWYVAVWYFIFQLLLSIKKLAYTRLNLYLGTALLSIGLSYLFYIHGIKLGLSALVPQSGDIATELWFLIIIFFYGILQGQDLTESYQAIDEKFDNKYLKLKKEFESVINEEFKENKFLNDILFAVMIFEDFNRPRFFRIAERVFFKLGFVSSTGIMQVKNHTVLSDSESVVKAQELILNSYNKHRGMYEYELVGKILVDYNPDAYYRSEVRDIFGRVSRASQRLEEGLFNEPQSEVAETLNGKDIDSMTAEELTSEINSLIEQVNDLNKQLEGAPAIGKKLTEQ